jgi:indolepyruvate ferredoxin oxidoreductase beta subunit
VRQLLPQWSDLRGDDTVSPFRRVLLSGVGGQGVLSVARWIGDTAFAAGLPVVVGQVHGLAQRGGSVTATVAIGGARSPEIARGMADVFLALEPMEAARSVEKVSRRTAAFVNTRPLLPVSLQSARRPYPPMESLIGPIREAAGSFVAADMTALAQEAGSGRALNALMAGLLAGSGLMPFPSEALLATILAAALPAFAEVNRRAFDRGEALARDRKEAGLR